MGAFYVDHADSPAVDAALVCLAQSRRVQMHVPVAADLSLANALQRDILAWLCDTRTVVRWIYRTRQLDLAGVRVASADVNPCWSRIPSGC